jgi:SnoaL-like domain
VAVASRNAEIVREAFARWAASDVSGVVKLYAPDVTFDSGGVFLPAGIHRGRRNVGAALVELALHRPVWLVRTLRLEESGNWVLAVADFDDGFQHVGLYRLDDGLIAHVEAHHTEEEGRERLRLLSAGELPEPPWATMGTAEFVAGHLEVASPSAALCIEDRRIVTTVPPELTGRVSTGDPVLVYLDDERGLLGWYLPEQQMGVDLRRGRKVA